MNPLCAQETPLCLRSLRRRRSLYSVRISTRSQLLLLTRNPFLVLVLGFGVVDSECRNEDSFQIVCTGVVRNFQNRLHAVVGDPSASFSLTAFASALSLRATNINQACKNKFIELKQKKLSKLRSKCLQKVP